MAQYRYVVYSPLTPLQVKIGITNHLEDRINSFRTTDYHAEYLGRKKFRSRKQVFADEAQLHRRFAHANNGTRGKEWFWITPDVFLWLLFQGYLFKLPFVLVLGVVKRILSFLGAFL